MDQCTLYEQILGLSAPWFVSDVELDKSQSEVVVQVNIDKGTALVCPRCGRACPGYDSRERRWRHLDTCQFRTQVVAQVPRVQCPEHGCLTVSVPWAEQNSRYTLLFEAFVISWLRAASISAVSKQLRLSWTAIDNIMERAVRRGLANAPDRDTTRLAVDETAFRKGQEIHRSRYTWLRHRKSLEGQQIQQIRALSDALKDTGLVWYLKEKARDIWQGYRVKGARAAWQEWIHMARLTGVRALASTANQIETKLFGILNAMRFQASNGLAEAINGQVRALKVRSRGFRSKERFKRAILFHYGGLPMAPNPHG